MDWTSRTAAANNSWTSVTYGNGLFVAVASSGLGNRVMTSSNGITWTSQISAEDNIWTSVTYGNGLFVAVANSGTNKVMTSPDGITWTSRTASNYLWTSVTYGNGLFVAVALLGKGNRVMTSPDGITWTSQTSAADNIWRSVTYGNGLFVAVASSGIGNRVMTSSNGITWTSQISAQDNIWTSVTYGNGLFVAVAVSGTGDRVMTSPDGITWTSQTAAADNSWRSVTYGNGLFVAVANSGTNKVMTSPDGITWTSQTSASDSIWISVTYGNGLFVAVADNGAVMTSEELPQTTTTTTTTTLSNFLVSTKTYGSEPFQLTSPQTNSDGAFSYTSSNPDVATISGDVVTIVGLGSTEITATQEETEYYTEGIITATFTVSRATTILSNFLVSTKTYGSEDFQLTSPQTNSDGLFSYESSNPDVATISGDIVTIVGVGTTIITATQAETDYYTEAIITKTFRVTLDPQTTTTLSDFLIQDTPYGSDSFQLTSPQTNSDGLFSYESSNPDVATISGDIVTIVGVGTTIITATQAETDYYTEAIITKTFRVNKATTTLSDFLIQDTPYGSDSFQLTSPQTNSYGAFSYTSSDPLVATISGDIVTIVGVGTTVITATQEETEYYTEGTITATLTVNKATTTLSDFLIQDTPYGSDSFQLTSPTSNSDGAFSYTSSNPDVATISGDLVTIIGVGTTEITATQAETDYYTEGTITATFTVVTQTTLSDFSDLSKTYGSEPFQLTAPTSNSDGAFSYTSSDESVATISGDLVTIVKVGTITITATQAATDNYTEGTITATLTVSQATTTLSDFSDLSKTYGSESFTITAPTSNSDGAFIYTSSDESVATISGDLVTIIGVGTTEITATQAATDNYTAASITATLTVNKATTTLSDFSDLSKTYGSEPFELSAPTSNSDGAFIYTSSDESVATISGDLVTIVKAGTITITATQAATDNYTEGTITATLTVNKVTTILSGFSDFMETYGAGSGFSRLTAPTSNREGAFSYTSSDESVATISGDILTIVKVGTITITASQAATDNYTAATITATLTVNKATTILSNFSDFGGMYGSGSFELSAPTSNSNGAFSYTSSNTEVATISGSTVIIVKGGSTVITASQVATDNYTAASITATLTVNKATTILSNFSDFGGMYGSGSFELSAPTSNSNGAFSYESSDPLIASISGARVTIVKGGIIYIRASQPATDNYTAAEIRARLTVSQATTTLSNFSNLSKVYGSGSFQLTPPQTNRQGAFSYISSDESVATISGDLVTIHKGGSTTIRASQAATESYTATSITATLTVSQATTILSNFSDLIKTYGSGEFQLIAPTSNSNGTFSYTSSKPEVATISGSTVAIVNGGSITITATQAATDNYTAATITATLQVNRAQPPPEISNRIKISSGTAEVSFTQGLFEYGSAAIINYKYSLNNGSTWITRSPVSTASPLTIGGLTNGTTYIIRMISFNGLDSGPSNSVPVYIRPTLSELISIDAPKASYILYQYNLQDLIDSELYTLQKLVIIGFVLAELKIHFPDDTILKQRLFTYSDLIQNQIIENGIVYTDIVAFVNGDATLINTAYSLSDEQKEEIQLIIMDEFGARVIQMSSTIF